MKRLPVLFCLLLSLENSSAQTIDLAGSYYHFSLAKMHDFRKEYAQAIAEFEKAIALNPTSSQLRVEFARTLWEAGEVRRAVEECERAVKLDSQNPDARYLLGQIFLGYRDSGQENMLDRALEEYAKVVELEPRHAEALYSLGRLHLIKKNYRTAAEIFSQLIMLQPAFVQGHYFKAVAQVEMHELPQAIETLEQSLKFRHDSLESLKLLGRLYEETGQPKKALQTYLEAVKHGPDPEIQQKLGALLSSEKRYQEAIPILRELSNQLPHNLELKVRLGQVLREDKKYSEAADVFYGVLRVDPDHIEANYELGRTLAELGERLQAIEKFVHLLKITESPDGRYSQGQTQNRNLFREHLGLLYQETRQYSTAVELFREMSRANPAEFPPKLRLVYALKDDAKLAEALTLTAQLLKSHPQELYGIIARAQVLSAADKLAEAVDVLKDAIRRKSDQEQLYLTGSQLYLDHGKHRDAERFIKEGLSRIADSERLQFQLGAIYERQKEFDRAEEVFRRILERNSEHAGVLNYLGYMLADRGVRLDEALGYIKKAVEIEPYNGAYLDSLGWAYFKLNELELAEITLTRAVKLTEGDPTIYDHLGDLYYKLGHYDKARKYYEHSVAYAKEEEEHRRVRGKLAELKKLLSQKH